MTPNSYLLIHQLSRGHQGKSGDLKDSTRNWQKIQDRIEELYVNHSKISKDKLRGRLKRELEMNYSESLSLSLVDGLY
jgi:ATP-dependent protease ClpP protease subunit